MAFRHPRAGRIPAAIAATLAVLAGPAPALAYDAGAWQKDLDQLKAEVARAYANLDWAVGERRMDLKAQATMAGEQLGRARSDAEARRVLDRFLEAFGDGHLYIAWPRPDAPAPAVPAPPQDTQPAGKSCADLGYRPARDSGLDFAAFPGWEPLATPESASFPAGILRTPGGVRLGVVRISLFMEGAYPAICEQVHPAGTACDDDCERRVNAQVGRRISRALAAQLQALAARDARAVVVDITGNGGGSDWADAATRIVTAPGVVAPRMAFIRHPHWVKQLRDRLADVETDLEREGLAAPLRVDLEAAKRTLEEAVRVAGEPCDRSATWTGGSPCALVAPPMFYSTGTLPRRPAYDLEGLEADHVLHIVSRYEFTEGAWRGPLAVLVDGNTASAAELFAATLQDNRRATIIGSPTFGSGCGYTGGGIAIRLANSGAVVKVPDCVRLRADGTNEVVGVDPDVLVAWRKGLSRHQRSARAMRALGQWADVTLKGNAGKP
jgi:hypothetical protein